MAPKPKRSLELPARRRLRQSCLGEEATPFMQPHHSQSIQNLIAAFGKDPTVEAIILGGSLAHGYARPDSDIDVTIVVGADEYRRRRVEGRLSSSHREPCTYENGYVDCKYVDLEHLRLVAARGSEPARYAHQGGQILLSRVDGLEQLLAEIVRYPVEKKAERIERFVAQLLAWRWYYSEAQRQESRYLTLLAVQKLILFGARVVLADNELLFPYHKWLLRVLESATRQPPGMLADIQALGSAHSRDLVEAYCRKILAFVHVDHDTANGRWPSLFLRDSELRWVDAEPCIDDL
jgi:polymorphic toxin system nucleotidyltransferase-like protein